MPPGSLDMFLMHLLCIIQHEKRATLVDKLGSLSNFEKS